jgi:hypothetical protein
MSDLIRDANAVLQDEVVGVVNDVIQLLVRSSWNRRELTVQFLRAQGQVRHLWDLAAFWTDCLDDLGVHRIHCAALRSHRRFVGSSSLGLWSGGRSPPKVLATVELDQHLHTLPAQAVFSEEIGWIGFSSHLPQVHSSEPHSLLDPQGVCVEMTKFTKALPVANADGRAGVCPDAQARRYTEVA